jgi:hypothetical protein
MSIGNFRQRVSIPSADRRRPSASYRRRDIRRRPVVNSRRRSWFSDVAGRRNNASARFQCLTSRCRAVPADQVHDRRTSRFLQTAG